MCIRDRCQGEVIAEARTHREAEVLLCGSGSATFAVVEDGDSIRKAADIVAAAKLKGMWARSCSFAPIGVRVLDGQGAGSNLGAPRKIW